MKIALVTPARAGSRQGNRRTALRQAELLRELGHRVRVLDRWRGEDCDLLIALHARKSYASLAAFRRAFPRRPVVLALTGTDLYAKRRSVLVRSALRRATRLVVLQPEALRELAPSLRAKTRVILQSAVPGSGRAAPRTSVFEVCVLAHLRAVKDPLRAARAARLLERRSRVLVVHAGSALTPAWKSRALEEQRSNPRYRWLGGQSHRRSLALLARARLFALTSRSEGGSGALAEAIASGVPVVATRIPGIVGMLGRDHPGLFEAGDTRALARLLARAEEDRCFLERLRRASARLAPRHAPEREREAWRRLLRELFPRA
jgi:putative glycosyltransferase (TIGR04348 family)